MPKEHSGHRRRKSRPPSASFAVVSDIHLAHPADADQKEYADNFRRCIREINRSGVRLTLVPGDITEHGAPEEFARFLSLVRRLRRTVRWVPGNHDVGDKRVAGKPRPSAKRLALYERMLGPSFYAEDVGGIRLVAVNSTLLGSGMKKEKAQWRMIKREARRRSALPKVLLLHYPLFVDSPDEPGGTYWAVEPKPRRRLLNALKKGRFAMVISGHLHHEMSNKWGRIWMLGALSTAFPVPTESEAIGWTLVHAIAR